MFYCGLYPLGSQCLSTNSPDLQILQFSNLCVACTWNSRLEATDDFSYPMLISGVHFTRGIPTLERCEEFNSGSSCAVATPALLSRPMLMLEEQLQRLYKSDVLELAFSEHCPFPNLLRLFWWLRHGGRMSAVDGSMSAELYA